MEHVERITIDPMKTTPRFRWAHLIAAALCVSTLGLVAAAGTSAPTVEAQSTGLGAGGEFHPLAPARIFDSRQGGIGRRAMSPQGVSFNFNLLGQGGIPADGASVLAVVLNVTVANPDRAGFLSITPAGAAAGESSLVNFDANRDVPNLAIVGVGSGGQASVSLVSPTGPGSANVIVDVFGWISTSGYNDVVDDGSRFVPVTPTRILDTRSGPVPAGRAGAVPLGPKEQLRLPIRGNQVVPAGGDVTGVMVNITAVNDGGAYTYVAAVPEPFAAGTDPATSVTNLVGGQIKANTAIVPIGADGAIQLFNSASKTHLIVDVLGYLVKGRDASTTAGRVVPLAAPFRALDTRQDAFAKTPLGFASIENWSFRAFSDSVTLNGQPLGTQSGLIGNLTATGLGRVYPTAPVRSFLTVFPGDVGLPNSSNVNVEEGENVPNMSLLKYGLVGSDPNVIKVYNDNGSLHYILDVYAVVLT